MPDNLPRSGKTKPSLPKQPPNFSSPCSQAVQELSPPLTGVNKAVQELSPPLTGVIKAVRELSPPLTGVIKTVRELSPPLCGGD